MNKYTKGKVNLMQGDCMDLMASKPDNYYDLAVVDPPYGIGMDKNAGNSTKYDRKEWDKQAPPPNYFDLLKRKSKNQIIWGANHFIDNFPFMCNSSSWLVWDKRENIIPTRTYADGELAWTSFNSPLRIFRHYWDGFLKKSKEDRIHVTQKPVKLYDWIFHNYAKPDFKILDTHGGSMSSAIAAYYFGCEFDCIELDEDYYNDAVKRFKQMTMQTKLF